MNKYPIAVKLNTEITDVKSLDADEIIVATGVITSYICPLMYMNNPLCKKMPVIDSLGDEFLNYVKDGMTVTMKADGIVEVE